MQQYDDLRFRGFSYDVRVLNAPLEVMVHRKALAEATAPARSGMLGHLVLESLERVLELRATGVHAPSWRRHATGDRACTCGLVVLDGLSCATSDGHLDFDLMLPAHRLVAAPDGGSQRLEAVCRRCAWAQEGADLDAARRLLAAHVCRTT